MVKDVAGADDDHMETETRTVTTEPMKWWEVPVARDRDNGRLGGVVAGLARSYGFDVKTTRIAVAIATLVLPVFALVYAVAWGLLPEQLAQAAPLRAVITDRRRLPLMVAIGIVIVAGGLGSFGSWFFFGGPSWGVGLIALGLLLWIMPKARTPHVDGASSETSVGFAAPTTLSPPTMPLATMPLATLPIAVPRRRRKPIAAIAILASLIYVLITAIGNASGSWTSSVFWVIVVSIAIVIAGIFIDAIVNQRWLGVPVAVLLMGLVGGLLITHPNLNGGFGARTIAPTTVAAAEHHEKLAAGELTLDLNQLQSSKALHVSAEVGYGRLHVIVPRNSTLIINSDLGAGHVVLDGHEIANGIRQQDHGTYTPAGVTESGRPSLVLDLSIGGGEIAIDRAN
jgi:phage shock protein PspC (stress-responsive transcriptional regulator)